MTEIVCGKAGPPDSGALVLPEWPAIMIRAGVPARERFLEFFAATIRNRNTRSAYFRAVCRFLKWADGRNLDLEEIRPVHVAAYIEMFADEEQEGGLPFSSPTIKQHLAAVRMLFDYLVTGQIVPFNPAAAVRRPRYSTRRGGPGSAWPKRAARTTRFRSTTWPRNTFTLT